MPDFTDDSNKTAESEPTGTGRNPVRPLRVWPAWVLVALMLGTRFGPSLLEGWGRSGVSP